MDFGSGVLVLEKASSGWTQCFVTLVKAVWSGLKEASCHVCRAAGVHCQFTVVCLQAWARALSGEGPGGTRGRSVRRVGTRNLHVQAAQLRTVVLREHRHRVHGLQGCQSSWKSGFVLCNRLYFKTLVMDSNESTKQMGECCRP